MTGKTHIAIGITAGLILSSGQPVENQLILILSSALGSLVPDLDHPKSKLNQKLLFINNKFYSALFYLSLTAGSIYLYFSTGNYVFSILGVITLLIGISIHRSFTHSIVGILLFSWIMKIVTLKYNLPSLYSGFVLGYVLHLVADFFTVKGIKLFFPLNLSISSPIIIKTSSVSENIIFTLLSLYSMFLLKNFI